MDCSCNGFSGLFVRADSVYLISEDAQRLEERLGVNESGYETVEQKQWMAWILRQVTPQERMLLEKRFIERLGQRDTASALGVSQMQVSRMERRLLSRLRTMTEHWQSIH
jgi:RNA polymerase sigma-B factor